MPEHPLTGSVILGDEGLGDVTMMVRVTKTWGLAFQHRTLCVRGNMALARLSARLSSDQSMIY